MPDQVRLEIDGTEVTVARGANLLTAARASGAYVPHLCWEEGLEADGCCGLCTVGVSGESEPVLACATQARDGMVVRTADDAAVAVRRRRLELIRADHRDDCARCAKDGHCELQEACRAAGVTTHVHAKLAYPADADESHPLFVLDRSRCILCGKCVKVCRELQGLGALEIEGRGFARRVRAAGTDLGASVCESCGQCVDRCPTAGLLARAFRSPTEEVRSVCPHCGVGCAVLLGTRDGRLCSVRAASDGPANRGALCAKGRFGLSDVVGSEDRLVRPQLRENGALRPASWDDALRHMAARLQEHVDRGSFALLTSARATTEENYVLQKFARVVMRTNNVDHGARLRHAPTVAGLTDCFGSGAMTGTIDDLDRTGCIVVIGSNTTETLPVIGTRIRRARRRRGTPLVVIDPRRTDLAQRADVWLRPRPGSDTAVLAGLARVVIDETLLDRAFIIERCVGYREFVSSLEEFTAPRVEALTGLARDEIRTAARTIAKAKSAMFLFGMGLTQHAHGTETVRALADLALLTANVGMVGAGVAPLRGQSNVQGTCDAGALPDFLPGRQRVDDPVARIEATAVWGREPPAEPGLPLTELWDAVLEKRIRALWVVGENPCLASPDAAHVEEALRSLDLLVVQDLFLTETARCAHIVLPAASFAEKDGTYTNTERRVQLVRRAVAPPGESRSDLDIVCALAQKMGAEGFAYDEAAAVLDEMALLVPLYRGISHRRLAQAPAGLQWPCPTSDHPGTATLHEVAFARAHGKAAFAPLQLRAVAEPVDEEFPLVVSTARSAGPGALRQEETVEIHPDDAARLGVVAGGAVRVCSRRGSVTARARVTEACLEGSVFMTFPFAESPAKMPTLCAVRVEPV